VDFSYAEAIMGEMRLSDCVVYGGTVYCVKEDGMLAVVQIKDIGPQQCPDCVIKALYKKLLGKK
jgi:hypothetical protein